MKLIKDKEREMLYLKILHPNNRMKFGFKFTIGSKKYKAGMIKYLPDGTEVQEIFRIKGEKR